MFEKASRLKLRFEGQGIMSTEDLWDLPLTSARGPSLDGLARDLHKNLKDLEDVSFVNVTPSPTRALAQLKFDIVKHIIDTKQTENAATNAARAKSAEKQQLLEILESRKVNGLKGLSAVFRPN